MLLLLHRERIRIQLPEKILQNRNLLLQNLLAVRPQLADAAVPLLLFGGAEKLIPHPLLKQACLVFLLTRIFLPQPVPVLMLLHLQIYNFIGLFQKVQVHLILRYLVGIDESQMLFLKESAVFRVLLALHFQDLYEVIQKHLRKEDDTQCGH